MEEDILNYLYQLSCFVGHPVYTSGGYRQAVQTQLSRAFTGVQVPFQLHSIIRCLYRDFLEGSLNSLAIPHSYL